jgi:tetratricopeptide (TPR) repeat protein
MSLLFRIILSVFICVDVCHADDSTVFFANGGSALKHGNYDLAIDYFSRAIQINSTYAKAFYARGFAYKEKGEYDKAILDFSTALQIDPNEEMFLIRANIYVEKKNIPKR